MQAIFLKLSVLHWKNWLLLWEYVFCAFWGIKCLFFSKIIVVVVFVLGLYFGKIKNWQSWIGLCYYFEKPYWPVKSPKLESAAFGGSRMDRRGSLTTWDNWVGFWWSDWMHMDILSSLTTSLLSWIQPYSRWRGCEQSREVTMGTASLESPSVRSVYRWLLGNKLEE